MLFEVKTKIKGLSSFKSENCVGCELRKKCFENKGIGLRIYLDKEEYKIFKKVLAVTETEKGKTIYFRRWNICESPNGFIKYNLNGKKLTMKGLKRNNTITKYMP